ncbi:MAG: pyridoxal phosphate-dependent aminotransferase [Oscillospiraceae bacterium]|jgi:alanine-synthesizing transaminase|nr:pyridoxal phosphate-dependent aminotransferase [Oscillospiraceae bacterium]
MKHIAPAEKLANVRYEVRGPVLDEAEKIAAAGHKILQLNTGNPAAFGFSAPQEIIDLFAAESGKAQAYCPSKGVPAARRSIAAQMAKKGIAGVTEDDVYIGNGASEMITMCMQALLNPGDEMLIPAPDYPLWTAAANLAGGKAVHYLCDEAANWSPDIADIKKKITPRTKGILIINPNNPTGALYGKDLLLEIAQIARENDFVLFADEIYDHLVMDGKEHTSIASLCPDIFSVTFNGLSKSHIICGFRVGWMALAGDKTGTEDFVAGINVLASMRLCANVPAQRIVPAALANFTETDAMLQPGGRVYEQRKAIVAAVNAIPGLHTTTPDAAFYIFPKIDAKRFNITDDRQFCMDFLRSKHVLLVNGRGFNWPEPDHFRIVYLPPADELAGLSNSLGSFLAEYQQ